TSLPSECQGFADSFIGRNKPVRAIASRQTPPRLAGNAIAPINPLVISIYQLCKLYYKQNLNNSNKFNTIQNGTSIALA
ncbi:MAG: hypothetical protein Q7U43_07075, partial [Methylococcaceae bacterium]|nr:hypothetical protein [Methylococcaceae bacterium]